MAGPTGALAAAYKLTRALQVASLLAIIGMTANFVSEIVNADATPPRVVVGVLSIVRQTPCTTRDLWLICIRSVSQYCTV